MFYVFASEDGKSWVSIGACSIKEFGYELIAEGFDVLAW